MLLKYNKASGTGYLSKNIWPKYYGNGMMKGISSMMSWQLADLGTNAASINQYCFPVIQTITDTWIDNPVNYITMSSVDYVDCNDTCQGQYQFMTAKGYRITIKADGTYSIEAPGNVDIEDVVRMQPGMKLIDKFGRVLVLRPDNTFSVETLINASHNVIDIRDPTKRLKDSLAFSEFGRIVLPESGCKLVLPNDVILEIGDRGQIKLVDADAKVFYEASPRGFNKYLNTSDVLEDFIRFLGSQRVKQRHIMQMPLGLLLNWLVIEAAEADGQPADDLKPKLHEGVVNLKAQPRCLYCRRFIARARHAKGITFCNGAHMDRYMAREDLVSLPLPRRQVPVIAPPSASHFARAA